jgi:hypothetical protein
MTTVGSRLWRFRKTCMTALGVGLVCGVVGYCAGPVIAGMMCCVGGAALTLSAMILVPLWRLMVSVNVAELYGNRC